MNAFLFNKDTFTIQGLIITFTVIILLFFGLLCSAPCSPVNLTRFEVNRVILLRIKRTQTGVYHKYIMGVHDFQKLSNYEHEKIITPRTITVRTGA